MENMAPNDDSNVCLADAYFGTKKMAFRSDLELLYRVEMVVIGFGRTVDWHQFKFIQVEIYSGLAC